MRTLAIFPPREVSTSSLVVSSGSRVTRVTQGQIGPARTNKVHVTLPLVLRQ